MANNLLTDNSSSLRGVSTLVTGYVALVVATIVTLAVLARTAPDQATNEAWGHAVIVGVFAVLMPLRLRAARRGSVRACRAVGIIAGVLFVVNVVEAIIPGLFPAWMRVEMIAIAVLMAAIVVRVARGTRTR